MNHRLARFSLAPLVLIASCTWLAACGPGLVGDPCTREEDCEEGLMCDVHDGEGTCQEPHEH